MSGKTPLRILIFALGGEGGGVLMNWIVAAARASGFAVQATSVPGVAQRTGSTSYYIEIASGDAPVVFNLMPLAGRVDIVVASELVEAGRAMELGFVSDRLTTLVASTSRVYTTAEKSDMGDGRYAPGRIIEAAEKMAKVAVLADLDRIARENATFISATLFAALDHSGALPWDRAVSEAAIGSGGKSAASLAGFRAAIAALEGEAAAQETANVPTTTGPDPAPDALGEVVALGRARVAEYQDEAYGALYMDRIERLRAVADPDDFRAMAAVAEAARRLALWMAYEDIARVAELKTRPDRFARIRREAGVAPGQVLKVTEYLKPRAEELADILPRAWGARIRARAENGGRIPLTGRGIRLRSNAPLGFWLLRAAASLRRIRRKSLRFANEQAAIEDWLDLLTGALAQSPGYAEALAALPRLRKGYSDTLGRGLRAYERILEEVVRPALADGPTEADTARLRGAMGAAMADETHKALDTYLEPATDRPAPVPDLRNAASTPEA